MALRLRGDIDLITSPLLLDQATYALGAHAHIVVDLSDATFIDSSAIHALLKINAAANREGCVTVLQLGTSGHGRTRDRDRRHRARAATGREPQRGGRDDPETGVGRGRLSQTVHSASVPGKVPVTSAAERR